MPKFRIRKDRGTGEPEVKMLSKKEKEKIEELKEKAKKEGKKNG